MPGGTMEVRYLKRCDLSAHSEVQHTVNIGECIWLEFESCKK